MSNKPCWYKSSMTAKWECGFFHQWSTFYEEFESGPGHFPAAIVEDAATEECHVVFAGHVSFANDNPDSPVDIVEKMFADGYQLPSKRGLMKQARFRPRMSWIAQFDRWLVQVHPETIEVFTDNAEHVCQVRWIDGKMDYSQGGLPLAAIEAMFMRRSE